jgi:hypothetical protein
MDDVVAVFKPSTSEYKSEALSDQANPLGFLGVIEQRFSNCDVCRKQFLDVPLDI